MDPDHLAIVRKDHFQEKNTNYCSVSALEFVAKLYGFLESDSFPLQSDPQNQEKGFGESELQASLGLCGKSDFYDIQSALTLIEEETNQGKCPIVSLANLPVVPPYLTYHIFVAVEQEGQPTLIDPANGQDLVTTREDLAKTLEHNSAGNPLRKTIHIQTLQAKTD